MRRISELGVLGLLALAPGALPAQAKADPVVTDPPRDAADPPRMVELSFTSAGDRLNGFLYVAQGAGPHPTVVLLHGYPGNERNLDLAQALRRAGADVLYFDYRGSWGSGGSFTFSHVLEDAAAALAFVRSPASGARADPRRIALLGHSMGGWAALVAAAADSSVACTIALDLWDVGGFGDDVRAVSESEFTTWADSSMQPGAPLDGSPAALREDLLAHAALWKPEASAPALAGRPVLVVSTTENPAHARVVAALRSAGDRRVTGITWPTDHGFSDRRIRLARTVVNWLRRECRF